MRGLGGRQRQGHDLGHFAHAGPVAETESLPIRKKKEAQVKATSAPLALRYRG